MNDLLKITHTFPNCECDEIDRLLEDRIRLEKMTKHVSELEMHVFLETASDEDMIFTLERLYNNKDKATWLLLGFNLNNLISKQLKPPMDEFGRIEGGEVILLGPEDKWRETTIHMPINNILPGYSLNFYEDPFTSNNSIRILPISLSIIILSALGLASWATFREVRRSHAVTELRQRFLAHVSHELKTPLSLIRMYAETLHLGRVNDPEQTKEYYKIILRQSERLSEMMQNVLIFARFGQLQGVYHLRDDDLAETVAEVLEEVWPNYEARGLKLHTELAPNLPLLPHDREGVTRILWNLLDNAAKYAGVNQITIRLYQHAQWVRLEVIDQGNGIPEADRKRLMQPFERGWKTEKISGSGLGLALVAQVAEVHKAVFSLEDAPNSGLCARVAFPVPENN